jgi:hypothetical protein
MRARLIIALFLLALVAAACGDDDAGTTTAAGQTTTTGSGGDLTCASLMSPDDVAALFGEPAVLDPENSEEDPAAGTANCAWASVEDEGDLQDLQVQLFQIQVYPSAEYYAPDIAYSDVEPIAGIGDEAFFSPQLGVSTGFRDGDLVAIVTFSVIGDGAAPDPITKKDQVIDLLRLVHDRVS